MFLYKGIFPETGETLERQFLEATVAIEFATINSPEFSVYSVRDSDQNMSIVYSSETSPNLLDN